MPTAGTSLPLYDRVRPIAVALFAVSSFLALISLAYDFDRHRPPSLFERDWVGVDPDLPGDAVFVYRVEDDDPQAASAFVSSVRCRVLDGGRLELTLIPPNTVKVRMRGFFAERDVLRRFIEFGEFGSPAPCFRAIASAHSTELAASRARLPGQQVAPLLQSRLDRPTQTEWCVLEPNALFPAAAVVSSSITSTTTNDVHTLQLVFSQSSGVLSTGFAAILGKRAAALVFDGKAYGPMTYSQAPGTRQLDLVCRGSLDRVRSCSTLVKAAFFPKRLTLLEDLSRPPKAHP